MENTYLLQERRSCFLKKLQQLTTPCFFDGLTSIYNNVKKQNKVKRYLLKEFQSSMTDVSRWSTEIIKNEHMRFKHEIPIVDKLILSIFQIDLVLRKDLSENAKNFIPKPRDFIHQCYLNMARCLWKQPFLVFDISVARMELQKNKIKLEKIIMACIKDTFLQFFPIDIEAELTSDNDADIAVSDTINKDTDEKEDFEVEDVPAVAEIDDVISDTHAEQHEEQYEEPSAEKGESDVSIQVDIEDDVHDVLSSRDGSVCNDINDTAEDEHLSEQPREASSQVLDADKGARDIEVEEIEEEDTVVNEILSEADSESDTDVEEEFSEDDASSCTSHTDTSDDDHSDSASDSFSEDDEENDTHITPKSNSETDNDLVDVQRVHHQIDKIMYEPRISDTTAKKPTQQTHKEPEIKEVYIGPKQPNINIDINEDIDSSLSAPSNNIKVVTVDEKKTSTAGTGPTMMERKLAFHSLKKKAKSSLLIGHKSHSNKELVNVKKATSFF